ncbi:hypothetical protein AAM32_05450 [Salmonella enterica subsp. enterica]|nr:hypothetical protein [Salmonella enterica subsp. enterica serovar Gatuni]ECF6921171.1 hypothetical protein [Salmonella enterica subsp. enterica]
MGGLCSYQFYKSTSFVGGIIPVGRIRRSRHPAVHPPVRTQKSPSVRMGFFTCLMPGSLWRSWETVSIVEFNLSVSSGAA